MKNTRGIPLVVRPIVLCRKKMEKKQNMRICEVVQLKLSWVRHFVVRGVRFAMGMSSFCLHNGLATKFCLQNVLANKFSYKPVEGLRPPYHTTKCRRIPPHCLQNGCGIDSTAFTRFRQPSPYCKRMPQCLAHKFCLQNSLATTFYLQTRLCSTLHCIAAE